MPNEGDIALAKIAVEAGYLPRELASQYWRQIQAPGSPRLVELLLRDGRLTPPQVDHLRQLYFQQQRGGPATGTLPAPADPRKTMLPTGDASESTFLTAEEAWAEALEIDTELARILLTKRLVSQPRLRECREIQLAQHMRLGDVLVQRNYLDEGTISGILEMVQDAPLVREPEPVAPPPRPQPPQARAPLPKPRVPAPPLSPSGQLYVGRPQPPLPPAQPRVMPGEPMRLTQELTPDEIVGGQFGRGRPLFESEPIAPPMPSSGRLQAGPEEAPPPPLMDQDEAPTVVGAKAVRRRGKPPVDDERTLGNMDLSVDELNPFAGFGGGGGGVRDRSDDSLDIIMEPSGGGGSGGGDLFGDGGGDMFGGGGKGRRGGDLFGGDRAHRAAAPTHSDDVPHLPMHSVDELDAFSDLFSPGHLGDSQAVTIEKDMRDAASEEAQSAWASGSEAWGPGPGFDEGPAPSGPDAFEAFDSEETDGGGYVNFNNLPKHEKLINSEDVPPRAPVGAAAFPDEGSEHPPAPMAPPPRPVAGPKSPRKRGGFLGKLIKIMLGAAALGAVGFGAYLGFSYLLQQEGVQSPGGGGETPPPPESPAGE